ncbi:MAG: hypothetical protein ACJ77B_09885 [Chloroflexota bacterium]
MAAASPGGGVLALRDPVSGDGAARLPYLVRVMGAATVIEDVRIGDVDERPDGGLHLAGRGARFEATATWSPPRGTGRLRDVDLEVTCIDPAGADAGLVVAVRLSRTDTPRWLIPGLFYGENRPGASRVLYPRYAPGPPLPSAFESDRWSFRADRAATPAVFAWDGVASASVATTETSPVGLAGIGFAATPDGPEIRLLFPYREEPFAYDGTATARPADVQLHRWAAGERARFAFTVGVGGPEPHAYAPVLRDLHARHAAVSPVAPWVSTRDAAALAAEGLLRWHYRAADCVLIETAAFERAGESPGDAPGDRLAMHVAWLSGAPGAYALLAHGRATNDATAVDAGVAVLDNIAANLAPGGTFWGQWTAERGWGKGWTPGEDRLHARTLAEATLFFARAVRLEAAHRTVRSEWLRAVASNLNVAVHGARADGALGAQYNGRTGAVESWDGAAGLAWVPALVEAASLLGRPDLLEAARRAGDHYARFVEDEFINGAPEDVDLAPTSEDGYVAVMAYVALAEADPPPARRSRWLELARRAADWMLTWRYSYNVAFPRTTLLGAYDYRSRGADQASVANQHLHAYGLICLPEMVRLARHMSDRHYIERTRENLACFRQFIAREDGDFNARRGMAPERYLQTACFGPKGSIGPLSHAWCLGLLLYAADDAARLPELDDDDADG